MTLIEIGCALFGAYLAWAVVVLLRAAVQYAADEVDQGAEMQNHNEASNL